MDAKADMYKNLSELCNTISRIYNKYEISTKTIPTGKVYFDVTPEGWVMRYGYHTFISPTIIDSMRKEIMGTEEFKGCNDPEGNWVKFWEFVDYIVNNISSLSDKDSLINSFIDYFNENIDYYCDLYIDCVSLSEDTIPFIDGITFKKFSFVSNYYGQRWNLDKMKTVIRISASNWEILHRNKQTIINALIFITGQPIHEVYSVIDSDSVFIKPLTHSDSDLIHSYECDVNLDNSSLEKLKSVYKVLQSVNGLDSDCIMVAQEMYRNALYQAIKYEGKIAFAVASLEALFTESESELKYKLYIRVSQFLKVFDYLTENEIMAKVYNNLRIAYVVRSKYVHGEKISSGLAGKIKDLSALYKDIIQINSACILLFIRVFPDSLKKDTVKKKEILELIDSSLISQESVGKLKGLLKDYSCERTV